MSTSWVAGQVGQGSLFSRTRKRAARRMALLAGIVMLSLIIAMGVFAPLLTPYDPIAQIPGAYLLPPGSDQHLLGTDQFGRDILSRSLYAIRLNLTIGFLGVLFPFLLGIALGATAAYLRGWPERIIMRTLDVLVAFPPYVFLIALVAVLGPSVVNLLIALTVFGWTSYARLARAEILSIREREFVLAAEGFGFSNRRLLSRHILPNTISPAIVFAMADIVLTILATASLSYLGLGVPAPTPEWGQMIYEGQAYLLDAWWLVTIPGLFIVTTGVALSLIGDGVAAHLRADV